MTKSRMSESYAALADEAHGVRPVFIDIEDRERTRRGPALALLTATCAECGLPAYKAPGSTWRHRRRRPAPPRRSVDQVPGQLGLFE
jgi:hypothetical protein